MTDEDRNPGDEEKLDELEQQMEDLDVPPDDSENVKGGLRRAPHEPT
jgi:hypothetical protein